MQFLIIQVGLGCINTHTHTHTHTFFGFRKNARVFSAKVLLEEAMLCLCYEIYFLY